MKKLSLGDPQDYLALLVRRKFWIGSAFFLLAIGAGSVTWLLPDIFVSETLILVEPREVPDDFVKDLVTVSTEDRLLSIQKTILSRTALQQIIYEFEDKLVQLRGLNDEQRVERMREDITVAFQEDRKRREPVVSFFTIAYQNADPELAQQITAKLANLFIEYDARNREEQVLGTADFLGNELAKVSQDLSVADQQLKDLKEKYQHSLPDREQSNLLTLDRLQARAVANEEALDRYFSERQQLERQISETPPVLIEEASSAALRNSRGTTQTPPLVAEYREKEKLLAESESRYTDKHPEVIRLRAELARLKQQIPPEELIQVDEPETAVAKITKPNPTYQSLQKQLAEVKTEISIRQREKVRLEGEINKYNARIQNTPARAMELTETQRRYDELKSQYDSLKTKLDEAKMSASLESVQKGAQFSIQDRANLPLSPAKPNRLKVLLLGLLASLAISLFLGFAIDFAQQRVWTQSELEHLVSLPVLIEIPEIKTEQDLRRNRRRNWLQAGAFAGAVSVVGLAAYVLLTTPRLQLMVARLLDPVVKAVSKLS